MKKLLSTLIILSFGAGAFGAKISNPFGKRDYKSQEIKYQYHVQKEDLEYNRDKRLINRVPSGYMTVEEYEKQSEYKDRATLEFDAPKIERPSDFKYVPKPLYKIVKYNDPPGKTELSLGRRLYFKRQVNGQGIVSPDYTKMVYPAVYYYHDSGSVGADLFVIPLDEKEANLTRILKANVAHRELNPILSTEKAIDNYAAFRSLTPVDFNPDGTKLLAKEKLGSSEDGIWATNIYVYDFDKKTSYDLSAVREAITYYWKEYMNLNLIDKRWDIYPLGFDAANPDTVIVQAYAYTGEKPVFLGTWSVDCYGNHSQLVSFDKTYSPSISSNGFKIEKDGVEEYQTVIREEKNLEKQGEIMEKQKKAEDKKEIKKINEDFKYELKTLQADFKDEYRDNRKLQTFAGSTEGTELEAQYYEYQKQQTEKDIHKLEKKIHNKEKQIDKVDKKIQKITDETQKIKDELYGPSEDSDEDQTDENAQTEETQEEQTQNIEYEQ